MHLLCAIPYQGEQEGPQHGGELAENVKETKEFIGGALRYQFPIEAPAKRLNAALSGAHQESQYNKTQQQRDFAH